MLKMKKMPLLFAICIMAVLLAFPSAYAQQTQFKTIGADALKAMMARNASMVVVDVRTEQEYAQGHLPGAINVSSQKSQRYEYIAGFLPKDKEMPVVFYCRGYS
jgi:predicted sulfurtransferase